MFRLALLFLVIALVAGLMGFNLVAGLALDGARILFFVFLALAVLTFFGGVFRGTPVRDLW
jgi:uncharacterized membrane protein YtjA (UPF0391 family)